MGKRYYCDFCDRSFADSGVNRKNHFKGVQHQRFRKQHYDSFRDPATILAEDALKLPCKRFYNDGNCDYGDSCKFSHMTPEKRQQLQDQIAKEQAESKARLEAEQKEPSLDEWLDKYKKRMRLDTKDDKAAEKEIKEYSLPPVLASVWNLPPSLLPPTARELQNKPYCDWG